MTRSSIPFLFAATVACLLGAAAAPRLHAAAGAVDPSFGPVVNDLVLSVAATPDNSVLLGGTFTSVNSTTRNRAARTNDLGKLDLTFDPAVNGAVQAIAVQADGAILLGGSFSTVRGAPFANLARVDASGALDTAFNPGVNGAVNAIAIQPDGLIVLGGSFTSVGLSTHNNVARINSNGSSDSSFNPSANGVVNSVLVQEDGAILLAGAFGSVNGVTRRGVARITPAGALDSTFGDPNINGSVACAALQADGRVLVGGNFTSVGGVAHSSLTRLNADGTVDPAFVHPPVNGVVYSLALQADGKIVLVGGFTQVGGVPFNSVARLAVDGTIDTFSGSAPGGAYSVSLQGDGRILLGGLFTTVGGAAHNRAARLLNDLPVEKLLVTGSGNGGFVRWLRGGAAPEAQQVTFESSEDGGATWTAPLRATRVAGGWQRPNVPLRTSGLIRARARFSHGYANGSSAYSELVAAYPTPDLDVQQPVRTSLTDGVSTIDFGAQPIAVNGAVTAKIFTVVNSGQGALTLNSVSVDGANAGDFTVDTSATSPVVSGGETSTTFKVNFVPRGPASGARSATLHIASNATGTYTPFDIGLTGLGLSTTADVDRDGMNDYGEYLLSALGFDWQVSQREIVNAYFAAANANGLYTTAQVQTINAGTPLIAQDAVTGQFTLTLSLRQSLDLQNYVPLSFGSGSMLINGSGNLEFRFAPQGATKFYRLEVR